MITPDNLDDLLDVWARRHALPEQRGDQILSAIVTQPVPLEAWWQTFTGQVADVMVQATAGLGSYAGMSGPVAVAG